MNTQKKCPSYLSNSKRPQRPTASFVLRKIEGAIGYTGFITTSKRRVDVEGWSKVWVKIDGHIFSDSSFYGDNFPWVLQPLTQENGYFRLGNLKTEEVVKLNDFMKQNSVPGVKINIQIKYKRVGKEKYKKSSVHTYIYDFDKNLFWLNV